MTTTTARETTTTTLVLQFQAALTEGQTVSKLPSFATNIFEQQFRGEPIKTVIKNVAQVEERTAHIRWVIGSIPTHLCSGKNYPPPRLKPRTSVPNVINDFLSAFTIVKIPTNF